MKSEFSNARLDKHPHFCIFDQQLKMTDFLFIFLPTQPLLPSFHRGVWIF